MIEEYWRHDSHSASGQGCVNPGLNFRKVNHYGNSTILQFAALLVDFTTQIFVSETSVSGTGRDHRREPDPANPVNLYCLAAMVADEASREGHKSFARDLEVALTAFLSSLPRDQQASALRLSYEMAMGAGDLAPPRLRLVYTRS